FRGYCRVVLANEVRRQLARLGRARSSGPLRHFSAATVSLWSAANMTPRLRSPADGSGAVIHVLPPVAEVLTARLAIRVWTHRYHERAAGVWEAHIQAPSFDFEIQDTRIQLSLGTSEHRDDPYIIDCAP